MILRFSCILSLFLTLFFTACTINNDNTMDTALSLKTKATMPFVIAGSGTNLPVTAKLAEGYYKKTGIKIDIPGSIGSDGAINAVKSNNLELGLLSKPLTSDERGEGLKEIPYARVAVIFATHSNTSESSISDSDIIEIIKGSKRTWMDGTKIHVFLRQNNDSCNRILYQVIPGYQEAATEAYRQKHWEIIYRDSDMSDAVKENKGAFGVTVSTEIAKDGTKTKALQYKGISPTNENIRNGLYPLTEEISFIYKEPLSNRAAGFLDYVFSEEGQNILEKWGSIPIRR